MMRYYRFPDEASGFPNAMTFWEVDDDQWSVIRSITITGDTIIASNRPSPPWGWCLPDQGVDPEDLTPDGSIPVVEITAAAFEMVWNRQRARYQATWEASCQRYPLGQAITGWIEIFYPQGMIVNLGNETYGVADYKRAKASAPPMTMYPGYRVTAIIGGYDAINQWVLLHEPQVWAERTHRRTKHDWVREHPSS